jgi:hypothetical protein
MRLSPHPVECTYVLGTSSDATSGEKHPLAYPRENVYSTGQSPNCNTLVGLLSVPYFNAAQCLA